MSLARKAVMPGNDDALQRARENLAQLDANPPTDQAMRPQWRSNRAQLVEFVADLEARVGGGK